MASQILWSNDATTTLAAPVTNIATTAILATGSGVLFPTPAGSQYFVATFVDAATGLLNEIVHVTNVTGDLVTMVRAQEGTTALNWSANDLFSNLVTAGTLEAFSQSGVTTATFTEVVITSSGNWTVPANVTSIEAIVTGGGAGAGGTTSSKCGGGGGGGGTAMGPLTVVPGNVMAVVVGTGGAGGTTGNNGAAANNSTFGGLTGGGGQPGDGGAVDIAGGMGGTATGGTINQQGGWGIDGSAASFTAPWASGGGTVWGGGARAGLGGLEPIDVYGAGGGAIYGVAGTGGAGEAGVVVIRYWTA